MAGTQERLAFGWQEAMGEGEDGSSGLSDPSDLSGLFQLFCSANQMNQ